MRSKKSVEVMSVFPSRAKVLLVLGYDRAICNRWRRDQNCLMGFLDTREPHRVSEFGITSGVP